MRISGDADLARRLQRLAERFDPDWQQPFVAVFGDVVGVQVANGFAGALKQARTLGGEFAGSRSEEHTSELQSLMRISYAVFCLKKKNNTRTKPYKIDV